MKASVTSISDYQSSFIYYLNWRADKDAASQGFFAKITAPSQRSADVMEAYGERSKIAHGRGGKVPGLMTDETIAYLANLEELLLRALHFFMAAEAAKMKRDGVLKLLDNAIVTQDRTLVSKAIPLLLTHEV